MTELLKHLDDTEESSIPLLANEIDGEDGGLFSAEEIGASRRRKLLKSMLTLMFPIVIFIGILLFASFKTYRYISYNLQNQKIDYKLYSISVKNASDDGFALSLNATVDAQVPWSLDVRGITLDVMKDSVSIVSTSIGTNFNVKSSSEAIPIILSNQAVKINDPELLAKLINKSVKDNMARIPLRIRTTIHPHWIPYTFKNIQIEKEIELDLKSGLPNGDDLSKYVKLVDLKMEEVANDDLIVTAKLKITNPLPFSIDQIPRVSFKIYSKDEVFIGKVRTLETIRLKKDSSSLIKLQGHLSPSSDSKTSDAIGELITNHLMGRSSKIYLRGDGEALTGGNLNWLQGILIHLNVPVVVPGSRKLLEISKSSSSSRMFEDSIKSIDVKRINFTLDPNKPDQIALDSDAEVHFNVPRFAKMLKPTIESLSLEGRVSDQDGNFIAPIAIPHHHVGMGLSNQNSLNTNMKLDINVNHLNVANIESFMAEMLYAQETIVSISGHSSVKTKMFLGKINVPRVPFSTEIKLPGLGRILASQEPEINSLKVQSITSDQIILSGKLLMNNPTEITSEMGWIQMNLITESDHENIGTVLVENVSIHPGGNSLEIKIFLSKNPKFIQKFIEKGEERIILQGIPRSELIHPILKNVIGAFVMKGKVVGKFGNFVSSIILKRKGFNLIPEAFMTVSNPFPFPMKIISVKNLHVYAYKPNDPDEKVLITEMEEVPLEEPIVIPANVENWIDEDNPLPLQMNGNILRSIKALELLLSKDNPKDSDGKKYLPTRIEAKIKSAMAGMDLELFFIKDRLPLYLEMN